MRPVTPCHLVQRLGIHDVVGAVALVVPAHRTAQDFATAQCLAAFGVRQYPVTALGAEPHRAALGPAHAHELPDVLAPVDRVGQRHAARKERHHGIAAHVQVGVLVLQQSGLAVGTLALDAAVEVQADVVVHVAAVERQVAFFLHYQPSGALPPLHHLLRHRFAARRDQHFDTIGVSGHDSDTRQLQAFDQHE